MRQKIALWSSVLIAITATTFAIASTTSVKTISGCVDKKTGVLRVASKCLKTETSLVWNQQGIQGEIGAQGPAGKDGVDGKNGEQGPQGIQGPSGPQGLTGAAGKDGLPGAPGANGVPGANGAPGATGATGPAGQNGVGTSFKVYDATNALVGTLLGSTYNGTQLDVLTPGGLVEGYNGMSGLANDQGPDIVWTTSTCTGTPYIRDLSSNNFSALRPIIELKGSDSFANNFTQDKVFLPGSESITVTTMYTPYDYGTDSTMPPLGCFPFTSTAGPKNPSGKGFNLFALIPFTGTLRVRFQGPLVIKQG